MLKAALRGYVRVIDRINYLIGRVVMFLLLALVGILYWGVIKDLGTDICWYKTQAFFGIITAEELKEFVRAGAESCIFKSPALWTVEMSQYTLAAYYLVGGAYSIQLGANIRMDLFYGAWTDRTKSMVDAVTVLFLIVFLIVLLYGGIESTRYSFPDHKAPTLWRPLWWPIKAVMSFGIFLMLLQAVSEFFKDILRLSGEQIAAPSSEGA